MRFILSFQILISIALIFLTIGVIQESRKTKRLEKQVAELLGRLDQLEKSKDNNHAE